MEDKIIIINGLGGCGKSTFIDLCKNYCIEENNGVNVYELSSIDFVKDVATFCGWDGSKTTKNRTFLHNIKVILEEWDDIPNKKVLEKIDRFVGFDSNNVFFVNIREPYNIEKFKEAAKRRNFECFTLIVENKNKETNEVTELINQINDYNYDIIVNNNGNLQHLYSLAKEFMNILIENKTNSINSNTNTTIVL